MEDCPDSGLGALTIPERRRQVEYMKLAPRDVADLQHNPAARPVYSKRGILPCLIKNMDVMFDNQVKRPWAARALMTAMGLPITEHHQALTGQVCQFSRGADAPAIRCHRSCCQQIGNAMHTAAMGSVTMLSLLLFPSLGERVAPTLPQDLENACSSSVPGPGPAQEAPSNFGCAFVLHYKRRRVLQASNSSA